MIAWRKSGRGCSIWQAKPWVREQQKQILKRISRLKIPSPAGAQAQPASALEEAKTEELASPSDKQLTKEKELVAAMEKNARLKEENARLKEQLQEQQE